MRYRLLVLGLMTIGSTRPLEAQVERSFTIRPGGRVMYVSLDTVDTPTAFAGNPFRVHRALVKVYQALKIPLGINDSMIGQVGQTGMPLRSIDGKRMSTWVGCGTGMTGPYADIHRVTAAIVSWVYAKGDSSVVRTGVFAGAVDVAEGSSSLPKPCATTGLLEERIRTLLREELAH